METVEQALIVDYSPKVRQKLVVKPTAYAVIGILGLQGLYIIILSLLNSFEYAWSQFIFLSPWMVPLVLGFGIQVAINR